MKFLSSIALALLIQQGANAFCAGRSRHIYHASTHLNMADTTANSEESNISTKEEKPDVAAVVTEQVQKVEVTLEGETLEDLKKLALELNPVIPYYDPLNLATSEFSEKDERPTIGFLRHAEIKHGRVAMAAFVGYVAQANGYIFNFAKEASDDFPTSMVGVSPENQWDALPNGIRVSIIVLVGIVEIVGEYNDPSDTDAAHYMRGGKPGVHPWWPKFMRKEEDKRLGRLKEINNGRLAMLGFFGFVSADSIPGSVPLLEGRIPAYDGNIWNPFEDVIASKNVFDRALSFDAGSEVEVVSVSTSSLSDTLSILTDALHNIVF